MWDSVKNFFQGTSVLRRVTIHAAIVLAFLLALWIVSSVFEARAERFAQGWRKQLDPVTCTNDPGAVGLPPSPGPAPLKNGQVPTPDLSSTGTIASQSASPILIPEATEKAFESRLAGQFHAIQQRINHHFDQMITYYSYSFATTIMVGILAAIAAIALVFITLKGWEPSSEYQKTIFLLATVTATYSAAFPGIFQLQKNVDDNRFLYLKYVGLANEMCSYQVTNETTDTSPLDQATFIHRVDSEMTNLNKIAVGFEISQIPDFSKAINQAIGQTQGGTKGPNQPPLSGKAGSAKRPARP